MDYEKKIRDYMNSSEVDQLYKSMLSNLFPELVEPKEEKARRSLLEFLEDLFKLGKNINFDRWSKADCEEWVNWVMKQGEQKPADKVEPRFKVGDWVVYECGEETSTLQIARIFGKTYVFSDESTLNVVDEDSLRLWDITKDAKDGDVLVSESNCGLGTWYCIFKSLDDDESMTVYCYLARNGRFETKKEWCFDKDPFNTKPATKEQRDLLFQKMKEAGYVWDAEKKELKGIEQKPAEWRITDEDMFRTAVWHIKNSISKGKPDTITKSDILDWFITLKERVQPRQEWSEEDKKLINDTCHLINTLASGYGKKVTEPITFSGTQMIASIKDRLSALVDNRHQFTWKPSDEQIESLQESIGIVGELTPRGELLKELYEHLKKLL